MGTVRASPDDVTNHIERLWGEKLKDVALDAGRDPGDSNLTIVRIVADLRLAHETARLRQWAIVAAVAASISAIAAAIAAGVAAT